MGVEKLQAYIDAVTEAEKSRAKVSEYGKTVANVAGYLNNFPYKMTVANAETSFVITADREFTLNADEWPSAKQLAQVLSDYIQKRDTVKTLYGSLSDEQKSQIKRSPDM